MTSLLTWYADVTHEVKPRLRFHSPFLPSESLAFSAFSELKHIMHKWTRQPNDSAPQVITYLLQHEYSRVDLRIGGDALRGADAHLAEALRAGEDFSPSHYNKRARYTDKDGDDDEDDDCEDTYSDDCSNIPTMGDKVETSIDISNLVDLDNVNLIEKGSISVGEEELIPPDLCEGEEPDDRSYEGILEMY
ncbi:hypothetical protein EW145_g1684 [Phellinidium pouzarii]|uniref:Uncharacterized protein n=1 Tax=Phellinidium pouzarii TaxID=167371 RepID=A0A4S4LJ30_9AGAM|nr:hypothetical protein EW145_g1684 [Phellinidium pouzarii]